MIQIKGFRGIHYNVNKFGCDWSDLVCPPYDVLDDTSWKNILDRCPFNFLQLTLPYPPSKIGRVPEGGYKKIRDKIKKWIEDGILVQDEEEGIYLYRQKYSCSGKDCERYGLLALLRLPTEEGIVLPHERTHTTPKEDRLQLIREIEAILEPIFLLVPDSGVLLSLIKERFQGDKNRWYVRRDTQQDECVYIKEKEVLDQISELVSDKSLLIADGHHRYEVSQLYRKFLQENGRYSPDGWYNYVLVFLAPMCEDNVMIFPICRKMELDGVEISVNWLKSRMPDGFEVEEVGDREIEDVYWGVDKRLVFAVVSERGKYLITFCGGNKEIEDALDDGAIDVEILHNFVLPRLVDSEKIDIDIDYVNSLNEAMDVREGRIVIIPRPVDVERVYDLAKRGRRLPQKSTFFYPKVGSGFVFLLG